MFHFLENNEVEIIYKIPDELNLIQFIEGFPGYNNKINKYKESVKKNNIDNGYISSEVFKWLYNISYDSICSCQNSSIASIEYGDSNGFNQNEVMMVNKTKQNQGFFEKFFNFFS